MKVRAWPLILTMALIASSTNRPIPAVAGELLPIIACDSLVATGPTDFDFFIWTHGIAEFCRAELRPHASQFVSAEPFLAWEMPQGWAAAWLPGEAGAIEIVGCTSLISPVLRVTLANPAGGIEARFFGRNGGRVATWYGTFKCASPTVPALPTTWCAIKARYR